MAFEDVWASSCKASYLIVSFVSGWATSLLSGEWHLQGDVFRVALFAVISDIGGELPAGIGKSFFVDDLAVLFSALVLL